MISWISPDKPYKVYCKEHWWGDGWDAKAYGRDVDFSRPFLEQLNELMMEVPWMDLLMDRSENSDYVNFCNKVKDCYLLYASNNCEGCMYSSYIWGSEDCMDMLQGFDSRLCYESLDVSNCYGCKYCRNCTNCHDLVFCENCQGCSDCFGSVNLVGKKYYFMNQPLNKEEYELKMRGLGLDSYSRVLELKKDFEQHRLKFPMRASKIINSENCVGDYIRNSKNAFECFDVSGVEDCKWIWLGSDPVKDSYDISGCEQCELSYECTVCGVPGNHCLFCTYSWNGVSDVYYIVQSFGSHHCFGCMAMRHDQYCILNKQYSKEEYEALVPRIVEHMIKNGEWGEHLPSSMSPFAYNETLANDFFPLTKEEALKRGLKWTDYEQSLPDVKETVNAVDLPDRISDVRDEVTNWAIKCEKSGKLFKISPAELKFYRRHGIPLPRRHPDQRHLDRLALRNRPKLYDRTCSKTGMPIRTTFSPDKPEIVYSEDAFRAEVY